MKVRNGFVSNSSSASFIVRVREMDHTMTVQKGFPVYKYFLNYLEIGKLLDAGFRYVATEYPESIMFAPNITGDPVDQVLIDVMEIPADRDRSEFENTLGYHVWCNEDQVVRFLVRNNIPFTACLDSGQTTLVFERDGYDVLEISNHGIQYYLTARYTKKKPDVDRIVSKPAVHRRSLDSYNDPMGEE